MRHVVERELHLPPQNIWFLVSVHELLSELIPFGGNSFSFTVNNFLFMVKIDWLLNDGKKTVDYILAPRTQYCFSIIFVVNSFTRCFTPEYPEARQKRHLGWPPSHHASLICPMWLSHWYETRVKKTMTTGDSGFVWLFSFACRVCFFWGGGHWYCLGLM